MNNSYSGPAAHLPAQEGPSTDHPMDLVIVEGFTGQTVIGIDDDELTAPQSLRIDLVAGLAHARACDTDRIADTINYGAVTFRLRRLLAEHRVTLLEALAERIADIMLTEFGALWVRVKVLKPRKLDDVEGLGVQIERWAADRTPRAA